MKKISSSLDKINRYCSFINLNRFRFKNIIIKRDFTMNFITENSQNQTRSIKNIKFQLREKTDNQNIVSKNYIYNKQYDNLLKFSKQHFSKNVDKDGFPIPEKRDIYDEDDLVINIGEKEKFKGMLIICPTPLGNINDISIRQFEAMKNGDVLACEDTRKTGKLLEFIKLKKMKEKFYAEFGISFEEFVDMGGLDMTDEQIQQRIFKKEDDLHKNNQNSKEDNSKEPNDSVYYDEIFQKKQSDDSTIGEGTGREKNTEENKEKNIFNDKISYDVFYNTKEDLKKNNFIKIKYDNQEKTNEKGDENLKKVKDMFKNHPDEEIIENIMEKLSKNKSEIESLDNVFSEINLNLSGKSLDNKKDILESLKLEEPIDQEFYSHIKDKDDFKKRKIAIENSDDLLKKSIDPLAEKYDKEFKLSYKLRNKARFIMGMSKKFTKNKDKGEEDKEDVNDLEEEITLNSGMDDDMIGMFRKKIKEEKEKKGRGLLIPFNQENEEKKIPKLIKAMKLGLRVVLISDSGTPTISDPGYRLVREAAKNGIVIEPLPGPCAVITGLSASALPSDKFMFYGYLPKNNNEKIEKLEEIKQIGVTSVLYETPLRLQNTLNIIHDIYGENHEIYLGLELTKKFETHLHGTLKDVKRDIIKIFVEKNKNSHINYNPSMNDETIFREEQINIKGEITLILGPNKKSKEQSLEEKKLRENIDIDIVEFTKRLNNHLNLSEEEMRVILTKACEIPRVKAQKVINFVKERKSSTKKKLEIMTNKNLSKLKVPDENKSKLDLLEKKERKLASIKNIRKIDFK